MLTQSDPQISLLLFSGCHELWKCKSIWRPALKSQELFLMPSLEKRAKHLQKWIPLRYLDLFFAVTRLGEFKFNTDFFSSYCIEYTNFKQQFERTNLMQLWNSILRVIVCIWLTIIIKHFLIGLLVLMLVFEALKLVKII